MSARNSEPPVGSEEPRKPQHSLPRYTDPTAETHRRISREQEAELALNNTRFTAGTRPLLIALFLVTIAVVPSLQYTRELQSLGETKRSPMFPVYRMLPSWTKVRSVRDPTELWELIPHAKEIKAAEKTLEQESVVLQWLLPRVQLAFSSVLHAGNEQVYSGRDGWLFYRADVDYVIGRPFLDPVRLARRAHTESVQPDPLKAIIDFRNQLAARGIDLIAMPVPAKPSIDSEELSAVSIDGALQNASFAEFKARLEKAGVRLFDPTPLLMERKRNNGGVPLYLETDTHWRPETMEFVAEKLATFLNHPVHQLDAEPTIVNKEIASLGDIATMLKLPPQQDVYRPQKVTIHQVITGNAFWRPSPNTDILLLGDSFSNIFTLDLMGWGESAGLAEHLSLALGGHPIDCILRNSDAAFATREILSHDLARGRDRLAGKKLIIWEFAARELAFGNWKLLEMKVGQPRRAQFFTPRTNQSITGTVEAVSPVPRPGTVPYKDHILAVHLVDIRVPTQPTDLQAIVYLWSMRDNHWTRAARLIPGDRISMRLRPWNDVSAQYEKINRTELDDPTLQLEEPVWGELTP